MKGFMKIIPILALTIILLEAETVAAGSRQETANLDRLSSNPPAKCQADHRVGDIQLTVTNIGVIGNGFASGNVDCFTGEPTGSCIYPQGSNLVYLFSGSFWIGAVVDGDTLVSVGADGWQNVEELNPDEYPAGMMIHRSVHDPATPDAVSEDDILSVYMDTLTAGIPNDFIDNRPHTPLNIKVNETSMAWSYDNANDFVIFNLDISNEGTSNLRDIYFGVYVDADVGYGPDCISNSCYSDDICGYVPSATFTDLGCEYSSDLNLAWIADNDGDPHSGVYDATSATGVTGTTLLRSPVSSPEISFNWWMSNGDPGRDFGPRERPFTGVWPEDYRNFQTGGTGTPEGDRNKYYIMRDRETDYDQVFTASIGSSDPLWMEPAASYAPDWSDGFDTRYLLSFGPFDLDPGQSVPVTFAYVAAGGFHVDPDNYNQNLNFSGGNYNPAVFEANLDFDSLYKNTRMAQWVFDNPGYDTDGDGYAGETQICCDGGTGVCDTVYITGDGIPDFRTNLVPSAPAVWATPVDPAGILVRFNGASSELSFDPISQMYDFEGYDVYMEYLGARGWTHMYSYDIEDYLKYTWVASSSQFAVLDYPFKIDELRCLYGTGCDDLTFNPLDFPETSPYVLAGYPDSIFYFAPMGNNLSELGVSTPIVKTYPDQPYPSNLDPSQADPSELTADGYFKYFEYQVTLNDLLPGNYRFAVTASDFGIPQSGIGPQESDIAASTVYLNTGTCCQGDRGNVNNSPGDLVDISDLTYLIDYIFGGGPAPVCHEEADVNGDGIIDITDLTFFVDFLFLGGANPLPCL